MTSSSRPVGSLNLSKVAVVLAWLALFMPGHADTPTTFTSLQSVADLVPEGIKVKKGDDWDLTAIAQASAAVSAAKTHQAVFQVTFGKYAPNNSHGCAYCVTGPDGTLDIHGTTIRSRMWVYLPADQADALSKCQAGSTITVSGTISRSDIRVYDTRCFLSFIIEKATVVGGTGDGVSTSSPAAAQSIAGTIWLSDEKIHGSFSTITFTADGQYSEIWRDQRPQGHWQASADNQQITVTRTDGEVLQFTFTADKDLIRATGHVLYKPTTAAAAAAASAADGIDSGSSPPVPEQAAPAADKPIINSLGVKFVPAGTAGVLFSVWDVRLKDFQAYVNATGYQAHGDIWSLRGGVYKRRPDTWNSPGFTQTENDPVVGVDGEEVNAFCQWLTRKERTDGSLPPNQEYRLPTKAEWSAAAESTQYPWGDQWPPPPGAGNFAGSEARDADWPPGGPTIDGYNDGFPRTSPVGSFRPNQYGLYDMGGDVLQICQDADGTWTTCGSAWHGGNPEMLRLDRKMVCSRPSRLVTLGFRVVLAVSSKVVAANPPSPGNPVIVSPFGTPVPPVPSPTAVNAAPTAKLTEDQARAVVLITGDNAEGTGFMIKTPDGPAVLTNIHVIANNPNLKITTNTGALVKVLAIKGASDRDLAMLAIEDAHYNYLQMAPDISQIVQPGDEVITPGNSEGGEVMLNTSGKVLGIGPERIEFDNPIYHGNSGGPVFHSKSGQVLGVVTEAMKVELTDELDKASFANRNSAISHSMRYFGLRLDTVSAWVPIDLRRLKNEAAFLDQFELRTRCLDSFLNAPNDDKPEDNLWRKDDKIVKANTEFFDQASGADTSQQMDADRVMWSQVSDLAATDMVAIQNPNNFYPFDYPRAKDEIAYRKALQAELDEINSNVSRLGSLPRTNNK